MRNQDQCRLTVYLFHLIADPGTRNSPLTGPGTAQCYPSLGLTLFYLISSFARDSAIKEQQSMSIALKALHERGTFVDPIDGFTFRLRSNRKRTMPRIAAGSPFPRICPAFRRCFGSA